MPDRPHRFGPDESPVSPSAAFLPFFDVTGMPVHVGYLWPTQEAALTAPTGDIRLAYCTQSGYIANSLFDPEAPEYEPGYEVSLHHSPRYQRFLATTARRLIDKYKLHSKTIVEIGCGSGYFLEMLCRMGSNDGYGIDPSIAYESTGSVFGQSVQYIRDAYSEKYADIPADLIVCRHTLQHIYDVPAFLRAVHLASSRSGAAVYVEIPNGAFVFEQQMVWNVFYEHRSYFTPSALAYLFRNAGFRVLDIGATYAEGQYLFIEARATLAPEYPSPAQSTLPGVLKAFGEAHRAKVKDWTERLTALRTAGKRVVTWGSGGRGLTFLNTLKARETIQYVVDINPDRQDAFVPGTGQQVVEPEFLVDVQPDVVIVTNPTYEDEIRQQLQSLGVRCEVLVA